MDQTFFFDAAWLPDGWRRDVSVSVRGERIVAVTAAAPADPRAVRARLVVPGLPNLHGHAFQRALAGLAERRGPGDNDDFWSWREVMYRFLADLEADDLEAIAAYAYADLLEAGYTSVGEFHYLHRSTQGTLYTNPAELALRHIAAANLTGIGITVLPVFYESSQFGGAAPTEGQRRFSTDLETFERIVMAVRAAIGTSAAANVGVAPHSLRAVTAGHLAALLERHRAGPIHIHVAEQTREVEDCLACTGLRPVEWLLRNADVDPRWCLIHATQINAAETAALARSGAVAGLCPVTEANLGDGVFPLPAYRSAQGRWGVGTDSHIHLDAAMELRQLEYAQRLLLRRRTVLAHADQPSTGASLFREALAGAAQALGLPVGAIAPGYRADFLVLDAEHPDLESRSGDLILDTWIFVQGRALIRDVIAGGRRVVENRRHRARAHIDAAYRRVLRRLLDAQS